MTEPSSANATDNPEVSEDGRSIQFGRYLLDKTAWQLLDVSHSEPQELALESRAVQVLAYLLVRAREIVSKDELLDAVWGAQVVSENALTQAITRIRRVLADNSNQADLIKTHRNRGYQFVGATAAATVVNPSRLAAPARRRTSWLPWVALTAVLAATVSVSWMRPHTLPQSSESTPVPSLQHLGNIELQLVGVAHDPEAQAFARSLTQGLHQSLPTLFAAESSNNEPPNPTSQPTSARLVGTVEAQAHRAVLNFTLHASGSDKVLWQVEDKSIALIDALAYRETLVETLAELTGQSIAQASRARLHSALLAPEQPFELLVAGRQLYLRFEQRANQRAIDYYQRALQLRPDFYPAKSSLALSMAAQHHRYRLGEQWLADAEREAQAAVSQSRNAYDAWRALGMVALERGKFETALEFFQTALAVAPQHMPTVFTVGTALFRLGRVDEAIAVYTRIHQLPVGRASLITYLGELGLHGEAARFASDLSPADREFTMLNYSMLYNAALAGDVQQARKLAQAIKGSEAGPVVSALLVCAELEQRAGNPERAVELFLQAYAEFPNSPEVRSRVAEVWMQQDKVAEARELLDGLAQELISEAEVGLSSWADLRAIAVVEAQRGNLAAALEWRQRSLHAGAYTNAWDSSDSRFEVLAENPTFIKQTVKMQSRVMQMRSRALGHTIAVANAPEERGKGD